MSYMRLQEDNKEIAWLFEIGYHPPENNITVISFNGRKFKIPNDKIIHREFCWLKIKLSDWLKIKRNRRNRTNPWKDSWAHLNRRNGSLNVLTHIMGQARRKRSG